MSDTETTAAPPLSDQIETHLEEPQPKQNNPEKLSNVTFSIWPPTQRTRDAVIKNLIETLSTPSVLSKRYGTMPQEEASATARVIEEEAFSAARGNASGEENGGDGGEDNGIEILQMYSREISKRMLEAVKVRSSASASDISATQTPSPVAPISSVES